MPQKNDKFVAKPIKKNNCTFSSFSKNLVRCSKIRTKNSIRKCKTFGANPEGESGRVGRQATVGSAFAKQIKTRFTCSTYKKSGRF